VFIARDSMDDEEYMEFENFNFKSSVSNFCAFEMKEGSCTIDHNHIEVFLDGVRETCVQSHVLHGNYIVVGLSTFLVFANAKNENISFFTPQEISKIFQFSSHAIHRQKNKV
jgi:hypothetical protein